jgi:hypothetical protein
MNGGNEKYTASSGYKIQSEETISEAQTQTVGESNNRFQDK